MASFITVMFFLLFPPFLPISTSVSQSPILPKAAFIPVTKDPSTLQYVAKLFISENFTESVNLVVDLNGHHVWHDSGFNPVARSSIECAMAESIRRKSNSKICYLQARNPISGMSLFGELNEGRIAFEFWDGKELTSLAKIDQFLFPSPSNFLLGGLANDAHGVLGLGHSRISLPSQFFWAFGFFHRKFSLCLSSSDGGIFLGGGPKFGSDFLNSMFRTPLHYYKENNGLQEGYYINFKTIKIAGRKVKLPLNDEKSLLATKLSTVAPYTTMESKIYNAFLEAYVASAASMNLTLVPPVAPFGACFALDNRRAAGANVPAIDFVLKGGLTKWRIHGRNSMVPVNDGVMCLGFVDGGLSPQGSITIGGLQLEDRVLEFDLGSTVSMLGVSSSSFTCSGFAQSGVSKNL